jgi:hypothetical protein
MQKRSESNSESKSFKKSIKKSIKNSIKKLRHKKDKHRQLTVIDTETNQPVIDPETNQPVIDPETNQPVIDNELLANKLPTIHQIGEIYVKLKGDKMWTRFGAKRDLQQITIHIYNGIRTIITSLSQLESKTDTYEQIELTKLTFVDYGGVAEYFLGDDSESALGYLQNPPQTKLSNALIFSFIPPNRKLADIDLLAETAEKAGFIGTIILTKKHYSRGKADVLSHFIKAFDIDVVASYYEDTAEVLDTLARWEYNNYVCQIKKYWIQPHINSVLHNACPHADTNATNITREEFLQHAL